MVENIWCVCVISQTEKGPDISLDSPVLSWHIFGQRYIALNDFKAVSDLLESRASNYSDRPFRWMTDRLMGRHLAIFNMSPHHPFFKTYRRLLQGSMNPRAVAQYQEIQEEQTRVLVRNLAISPENFINHFRRWVHFDVALLSCT